MPMLNIKLIYRNRTVGESYSLNLQLILHIYTELITSTSKPAKIIKTNI